MNTTAPAVLYVADLAKLMGRTETAIRAAANRAAPWLPPSFKSGHRLAWLRTDVDRFLADQAKKAVR